MIASEFLLLCKIYFVNTVGEPGSCALVTLSARGQHPRIFWLLVLPLRSLLHFFSLSVTYAINQEASEVLSVDFRNVTEMPRVCRLLLLLLFF